MKRGLGSWEAWASLLVWILIALFPILVGFVIFKLYRHFRPIIKQEELTGLAAVGTQNQNGFFIKVFVGWLICGPIYYVLYTIYG